MSGGSYNYLCNVFSTHGLFTHEDDLEAMTDRLADLGFKDAAEETYKILTIIRAADVRIETMLWRLQDVWKAVEWNDSGDWGIDRVEEVIKKYRGER
jgi:hypothetical protein